MQLAKCNNCGGIFEDLNPSEQKEVIANVQPLQQFEENGEKFWGCPNCQTDGYLSDFNPEKIFAVEITETYTKTIFVPAEDEETANELALGTEIIMSPEDYLSDSTQIFSTKEIDFLPIETNCSFPKFLRNCMGFIGHYAFHPDTPFEDYVTKNERLFTDAQAEVLNRKMKETFSFFEDFLKQDTYDYCEQYRNPETTEYSQCLCDIVSTATSLDFYCGDSMRNHEHYTSWATEFWEKNRYRQWDGEYIDEITLFTERKIDKFFEDLEIELKGFIAEKWQEEHLYKFRRVTDRRGYWIGKIEDRKLSKMPFENGYRYSLIRTDINGEPKGEITFHKSVINALEKIINEQ